jgi:hypothetical protein
MSKPTEYIIMDAIVKILKKTNKKKTMRNEEIDTLIQKECGLKKSLTEPKVRECIHYIRLFYEIKNDKGELGWICGTSDGYYISYTPNEILSHLESFEGKIRKMMLIHKKGMSILQDKIYYRQSKLKLDE